MIREAREIVGAGEGMRRLTEVLEQEAPGLAPRAGQAQDREQEQVPPAVQVVQEGQVVQVPQEGQGPPGRARLEGLELEVQALEPMFRLRWARAGRADSFSPPQQQPCAQRKEHAPPRFSSRHWAAAI